MKTKHRKSKAYLIVSSAHIGINKDVIATFAQVAKYYKAEVFHLGPLITDKESKSYAAAKLKYSAMAAALASVKKEVADTEAEERRIERKQEKLESGLSAIGHSIQNVELAESSRLRTMVKCFGKITAVLAPDFYTKKALEEPGVKTVNRGVQISKYMYFSAISPSGERATVNPITNNAIEYLKLHGKYSYVVAHPVPAVHTTAKEGLNNAHKFYTVGSMRDIVPPDNARQFYQIAHMPCATLIIVDDENGEYHSKHLFIDYVPKTGKRMVLDDGLVFFPEGVVELPSSDKGSAVFDQHAPYQHPGVLGALCAMNDMHEPETFIDGGDNTDFTSICPYTSDSPGERENLRLIDCLDAMSNLLKAESSAKSIKRRILIDSNHHEWLSQFVSKNPSLKKMLDWATLAKTRFPDWEIYIRDRGENKTCKFGDYLIRHGDKESLEKGMRLSDSGKYLCGHHHQYYTRRRAVAAGCGCGLGPKFIGNQITAWLSQIVSLSKYQGVAAVNPKTVLHDEKKKLSRFAYREKIYEVDYCIIGRLI